MKRKRVLIKQQRKDGSWYYLYELEFIMYEEINSSCFAIGVLPHSYDIAKAFYERSSFNINYKVVERKAFLPISPETISIEKKCEDNELIPVLSIEITKDKIYMSLYEGKFIICQGECLFDPIDVEFSISYDKSIMLSNFKDNS